jgi:hypothetical protein
VRVRVLLLAIAALATAPGAAAQRPDTGAAPTISARTAGLTRNDGFVPFYLEPGAGALWLELPRGGARVLFCTSLSTGLGSNPVGLDRGESGACYVARTDPAGKRQLLVFENWSYRSSSSSAELARSVEESFAPSTVASLPVLAEEGDRVLVDGTDLALRDWRDVPRALADAGDGAYAPVKERSRVLGSASRGFPRNTELESALTFEAKEQAGPIVRRIAPDGRSFTVRQRITLAALPDSGYRPRELDPRMGFFGIEFKDYAQPVNRPLTRRWIARHRLERTDPRDPRSPIHRPIVFYVDRAIPEPIRTATLEGARFWVEAFDRAGLAGGFRAELMPEGADPLDIRYNVIQWQNRNEIGWSIGGGLIDPRTGEMLKGAARMDSHRARTSWNIAAALAGAANASDTHFVLGRVRQVTAHEVGHTLGIAHNYIASTYGRGSVMDYPPPRVGVDRNGRVEFSEAYALGPGAWDVLAVRWGYGIFPPEHERDSLAAIVREGLAKGLVFLSDDDARPASASDPRVNLWDDGAGPEEFLERQMAVRRAAMRSFGLANLHPGEPVATLQERFARLYFFHRFAVNAAAKAIGGVEYHHAVSGDGQQATRRVPAARQRGAVTLLLGALAPAELAIPDTVLTLLGPRPFGYEPIPELFGSRTGPVFDELGAAATLAQLVLDPMLQRERLARVAQQSARDAATLGLAELLATVERSIWDAPADRTPRDAALRRTVQRSFAGTVIRLAADTAAAPEVRAMAELTLERLGAEAGARGVGERGTPEARAHWRALARQITRWREEREVPAAPALPAPPGDPFGDGHED